MPTLPSASTTRYRHFLLQEHCAMAQVVCGCESSVIVAHSPSFSFLESKSRLALTICLSPCQTSRATLLTANTTHCQHYSLPTLLGSALCKTSGRLNVVGRSLRDLVQILKYSEKFPNVLSNSQVIYLLPQCGMCEPRAHLCTCACIHT